MVYDYEKQEPATRSVHAATRTQLKRVQDDEAVYKTTEKKRLMIAT